MNPLRPLFPFVLVLFTSPLFLLASAPDTIVSQLDIYYESGEYHLSEKADEELSKFIQITKKPLFYSVEILGHTDSIGSVNYNKRLAKRRAEHIVNYLTEKGIDPKLISAHAIGERADNGLALRNDLWKDRSSTVVIKQVDYLEGFKAERQTFTLDPSRINVLNGRNGTKVIVPDNVFRKRNGSPVFGLIQFELTEYYQKSDFVLNDLHTMSGDRIIESGGTVYLKATQNGNELVLKEGEELRIKLPSSAPKSDMQAFFGVENDSTGGFEDWALVDNGGWVEAKNVTIDFNRAEQLLSRTAMNLEIDSKDRELLEFFGEPGNEQELGILIGNAIRKKDEKQLQNLVERYKVDLITAGREIFTDSLYSFTDAGRRFSGSGIIYRKSTKRKIDLNEETFARFNFSITDGIRFESNNSTHIVSLTAEKLDFSKPRSIQNYLMRVGKMGWINCDRFLRESNVTLTELVVEIDPSLYKNINLSLVFKEINSVMPGQAFSDGRVVFHNVPIGKKAMIFGHTLINNQLGTVLEEIVIGREAIQAELEESTVEDFQATVASLNL